MKMSLLAALAPNERTTVILYYCIAVALFVGGSYWLMFRAAKFRPQCWACWRTTRGRIDTRREICARCRRRRKVA